MILDKVLKGASAVAAVAAAAAVAVVAASFALYALLEAPLGRAGAAAIVALVFALLAIIIALVAVAMARGSRSKKHDSADQGVGERLMAFARQRPIVTAGAAIAAGVIAIRNPAVVGLVIATLLGRQDTRR